MFYGQLLQAEIPKVQKETDNLTVFLRFLGSGLIKAVHTHVGEIDSKPFKISVTSNWEGFKVQGYTH